MARFFYADSPCWWRKYGRLLLAIVWSAGLICGILVIASVDDHFLSLMRSALYVSVSIVGLLSVTLLPFLLTAFAVFICQPVCLLFLCFVKAVFFSFTAFGVSTGFGDAGWLIWHFLLFSDFVSMPLLYWLWLRCSRVNSTFLYGEILLSVSAALLIGSVNCRIISPFLARLIVR